MLVTGASGGIGHEIAKAVGDLGANVIAQWANNLEGAEAATTAIPPDRKLLLQADFSTPSAVDDLWANAVDWTERVDVVVNNAAVMPEAGIDDPDSVWDEVWTKAMMVNAIQPTKLLEP